jgi:hypothetical protein
MSTMLDYFAHAAMVAQAIAIAVSAYAHCHSVLRRICITMERWAGLHLLVTRGFYSPFSSSINHRELGQAEKYS